ncbi:hypothetical protein AgCh_013774 [Apium graveolens]
MTGKHCIEVTSAAKIASISEEICIGCGICVKECPFKAIQIINLPKGLDKETTHRYVLNTFKLHRLPTPRPGQVLGLVGTNGIRKSTALKILAGKLKPNLGRFNEAVVTFTSLGLDLVHEYEIKVSGITTGPNGDTPGMNKPGTCKIDSNAIKGMHLYKFEEKRAMAVAAL